MLVSGRPDVEVAVEVPGAGRVPDSGSPDVGAERGVEVGSDVPPGTHVSC